MTSLLVLKRLSKMRTQYDIQLFESGVWELAQKKDTISLKELLSLFDDNCPYYEVMYSLVHAIETYPKDLYVACVVGAINHMVYDTPFWADCLCNRIFNDLEYRELFLKNMHLSTPEALLRLCDLMQKESPHHLQFIEELRQKITPSVNP